MSEAAGGFGIRPVDATVASARLDEAARVAAETGASLRAALAGLGDVLGTDEQGRAVAARYEPQAAAGLSAIARRAGELAGLAEALTRSARAYEEGDAAAAPR